MNRLTCQRPASRNGMTLVELLIVISAFSLLMVITAFWLHQAMTFASTINKRQRYHQNIVRLADRLRDDVRTSQEMSLQGNKLTLTLEDDQTITYVIESNQINIEKQTGKQLRYRDCFRLIRRANAKWDATEMPDWISLIVERSPPTDAAASEVGGERPETKATSSNRHSVRQSLLPVVSVDLHIRVRPNPWPIVGDRNE